MTLEAISNWVRSAPEGWRAVLEEIPPPEAWHAIAVDKPNGPERARWKSSAAARSLLGNLADAPALESWIESLALSPGMAVLDACCGAGVTSRMLAARGHEVVGADIDTDSIRVARSGPSTTANFEVLDLRCELPGRQFDAVLIEDWWDDTIVANLAGAIRPGGRLIVRLSNLVPPVRHGDDPLLNAAWWAALHAGYNAEFGPTAGGVLRAATAAGFTPTSSNTTTSFGVVSTLEGARRHLEFACWESLFVRPYTSPANWEALVECWDPGSHDAWWRRRHPLLATTFTSWECGPAPASTG